MDRNYGVAPRSEHSSITRLWTYLGRKAGFPPDLERRVVALEHWRNVHEDYAHGKALSIESDINMLVASVSNMREELHGDRLARAELGTLNTEAILQGFREASEGIVTRVIDTIWSKIAINRADIDQLKTRVNVLELRGEDGK